MFVSKRTAKAQVYNFAGQLKLVSFSEVQLTISFTLDAPRSPAQ